MEQDLGWELGLPVESGECQQALEGWLPLTAPWKKTCWKVRDQLLATMVAPKKSFDQQMKRMDFAGAYIKNMEI
jgi:hypothetical protein